MIKLSKEVTKRLSNEAYYNEDDFISDCKAYIKAVKSGRILYTVTHVSNSGMSRDINIKSYEGTINKGYYRSYYGMLEALGYSFSRMNRDDIKVGGCGMNMLFATNYNIIHSLYNMKFISKAKCDILAQKVN